MRGFPDGAPGHTRFPRQTLQFLEHKGRPLCAACLQQRMKGIAPFDGFLRVHVHSMVWIRHVRVHKHGATLARREKESATGLSYILASSMTHVLLKLQEAAYIYSIKCC
jgi:hypothetical protein